MSRTWRGRRHARRLARALLPPALLGTALRPSATRLQRTAAGGGLLALWSVVYHRYRRAGKAETARELELLRTANWDAFSRHYNERVPTVEEEFALWGAYHQHRHEMRYDLVAREVRRHLVRGGCLLDVGCGSAMVADRLLDLDAHYVGADFGGHHVRFAASKHRAGSGRLAVRFVRADGERLPVADGVVDVVVMSEVIEHLLRPELSVWEVARVLRPGGVYVMTTNNASEVPLRSPLTHLFAWLEKALGARRPGLISRRPWVWPVPVDRALLGDGGPDVYLPHTHHIAGETARMLAAAGLETVRVSTFEFPPPQSASAAWLDRRGAAGRRAADGIEAVARRTPLLKRMGCHLFLVARKTGAPTAIAPPPGVWPGPFSDQAGP